MPLLVKLQISDYLKLEDKMRLASVSQACRQWVRFTLQRATKISRADFSSDCLIARLPVGSFIALLRLMCAEETGETKLRKIDFSDVRFDYSSDDNDDKGLWSAIGALCPQLEDLNLGRSKIPLKNIEHLLTACKKLRKLVSHPYNPHKWNFKQLFTMVSECTELKELEISSQFGMNYSTIEVKPHSAVEPAQRNDFFFQH